MLPFQVGSANDVLRWAHKALGQSAESAAALAQFEQAKQAREAANSPGA